MKRVIFIIFFIFLLLFMPFCGVAQKWHIEEPLQINRPGMVEIPLLAELHHQIDDGLDLRVIGPDGQSRPFELYWHEDKRDAILNLIEKSSKLVKNIFIWETLIPANDRIKVKSIKINVLSANYIGSIDIFGLNKGSWIKLTPKSVLYSAGSSTQVDIKIAEYTYEGFRLKFTGCSKKPLPIGYVQALGEKPGNDYTEVSVDLKYKRTNIKDSVHKAVTELIAALPGSGLYIKEMELRTVSPFNGNWSLERQDIQNGQRKVIPELTGTVNSAGKGTEPLKIKADRIWKSKMIILKLIGVDHYVSDAGMLSLKIRIPRLAFFADAPGTYLVQTGLNHKVNVREYPSARRKDIPASVLLLSNPKTHSN
jgi:hypothetical protein